MTRDIDTLTNDLGIDVPTLLSVLGLSSTSELSPRMLVNLLQMHSAAMSAFTDTQLAAAWLLNGKKALGDRIPLHLAQSDSETQTVVDLLGRIEHGVFS